ncbi:NUDIX domain-containing protein [Actinocorallia sp. API 0066]|uniref:NUDIX hydrolase n=1 Tax=Actinocorallia sp. API 0066 TaxID=2896846 RepID=UPI001E52E979|nr:NUDIX domain-containing protein [Actinocorallia sp. API 0066]MCD0449569.1 NUDIX domain-containing protein [Actinocorallia sp. API 0066]
MSTPPHRPSARVLLVDEQDRLLLFLDGLKDKFWLTPGGGLDPGETVEQAAARELFEETGLSVEPAALGPVVATASGYYIGEWDGVLRTATDTYFFLRTEHFEPDTAGFTDYERQTVDEHRWWPLADIVAAPPTVVPWGLSGLLPGLLSGRPPQAPVALPWHHPGVGPAL